MIIGVPKEIKNNENRVGMTPCRSSRIGEARSYSVCTGISRCKQRFLRRRVHSSGCENAADHRSDVCRGGNDCEGERAYRPPSTN